VGSTSLTTTSRAMFPICIGMDGVGGLVVAAAEEEEEEEVGRESMRGALARSPSFSVSPRIQ
jgi:hypothetical protein